MVDPGLNTVLSKSVAILRAFNSDDTNVSLAELVRRTGLHKATVFRLAAELVELRLLEKSESGYRLSGGMFELGMRAAVERTLLEVAMPFLQDLYERTHEIVHLGIREGHHVVYVAKLGGHRQVRSPSRVGGRMPMHCTAIGKVFLAHDPIVRREILSAPLERRTPHTVATPGRLARQLSTVTSTAAVCAAISVAGPTTRFRPEAHTAVLRATGAALGTILARRSSSDGH